jgi:hypothetical protein
VSINSLGYYEYYVILYLELSMTISSITAMFYRQHDQKRRADQFCQQAYMAEDMGTTSVRQHQQGVAKGSSQQTKRKYLPF